MRLAGILLGGALYALALPPVDRSILGWVALVPLVLALERAPLGTAFRYGCLFGYVMGWCVLWTLADAGTRYFGLPWPLSVTGSGLWFLVVVGVPFGLFALGVRLVERWLGDSLLVPPLAGAIWVSTEMLRGRVIAQPWALLGYTQHTNLTLIQIAAVTGVYGVSFVVALTAASFAKAVSRARARAPFGRLVAPLATPAVVLLLCCITGWRAETALDIGAGEPRDVAVVQTNFTPVRRWTRAYTGSQLAAHLRATQSLTASPALIVWPENAVPGYVEQDPALSGALTHVARREHADLLVGAPRFQDGVTFNSTQLIGADGTIRAHYDKRRLVLFAETSPLHVLRRSEDEVFAAGTAPGVLQSFVRLGVSICHEIIHPDLVNDSVRHGAELLVNVANDAWITGTSPAAAEQHLAMATFRSIETRRFLVRAALTGVSAIIDPMGRIVASVPIGQAGVATAAVRGSDVLTWYVRLGDAFGWACVLLTIGCVVLAKAATRPALRSVAH